jgi:hypothetical protein
MNGRSHLDYLTISYASVKNPSELGFLDGGVFGAVESIKPLPHYDTGWKLRCGGQLHISSDTLQGSRLDLRGDDLENLRAMGLSDAQILFVTGQNELKKRTTRIDYAWDIFDAGSVRHVINHWKAGKCKTTFRKSPQGYLDYGTRAGQTAYFGSRKGEQFVRVYDKGTEMNLLKTAWLRVEMQIRNPHAGEFYGDCIKSSIPRAARTRLLSLVDFPHLAWWKRSIHGELTELGQVPRKQPKWQKWMSGQVKESIIQHWNENQDNDREFIKQWLDEMIVRLVD